MALNPATIAEVQRLIGFARCGYVDRVHYDQLVQTLGAAIEHAATAEMEAQEAWAKVAELEKRLEGEVG